MKHQATLATYPSVTVRVACRRCSRQGQYRLARLVERHGADMTLMDLIDVLAANCEVRQRHSQPGIDRCSAHFPDLSVDRPADVQFAVPRVTAARVRDER